MDVLVKDRGRYQIAIAFDGFAQREAQTNVANTATGSNPRGDEMNDDIPPIETDHRVPWWPFHLLEGMAGRA
jgi:hypothetical protein